MRCPLGLILVVAAVLNTDAEHASPSPTRLIIDTDMSGDCDDVGAVCIAHALMTRGEANLIAVVHNTGVDTGIGAVSAINTYYGRESIPLGAYKGSFDKGLRGPYIDDLVDRFPSNIKNASQVPDALKVLREALAASPDQSVWISSIGFTTNLELLLKSPPDSASPLNGTSLVKAKVKGLAWMGGRYPNSGRDPAQPHLPSPEHNFGFHCTATTPRCNNMSSPAIGPSTAFVNDHWPATVPIVFLGWEVAQKILTGGVMTNGTPVTNPCRQAYIDHSGAGKDRQSWDPATTLYAVRGAAGFYNLTSGQNVIAADGNNRWIDGLGTNRSYLVLKSPSSSAEAVRGAINELLLMPPARRSPAKSARATQVPTKTFPFGAEGPAVTHRLFNMSASRGAMGAAPWGTSSVAFAGGSIEGQPKGTPPTNHIDVFDVSTSSWSSNQTVLPHASAGDSTCAGQVGETSFFGSALSVGAVDLYDATSGTWTSHAVQIARDFSACAGASSGSEAVVICAGGQSKTVEGASFAVDTIHLKKTKIIMPPIHPRDSTQQWRVVKDFNAVPVGTAAAVKSLEDCEGHCSGSVQFSFNEKSNHCFCSNSTVWNGTVNVRITSGCTTAVSGCPPPSAPTPAPPPTPSTHKLSVGRKKLSAASQGDIIMFGMGYSDEEATKGYSLAYDMYNVTSGEWSAGTLPSKQGRQYGTAVGCGGKIMFAGGQIAGGRSAVVDIFDVSEGHGWMPPANLSQARSNLAAACAADRYALFAGGQIPSRATVDVYDTVSGQWSLLNPLNFGRGWLVGAGAGDCAVFSGGGRSGNASDADVYCFGSQR